MNLKYCISCILILSVALLFTDCKSKKTENKSINAHELKEPLIRANKRLIKKEKQNIKDYIRRHKLDMTETASGLYYQIFHQGTEMKIKLNDTLIIDYNVRLLSGTLCYSSKINGEKKFIVGRGNIEKGLDEGILLLNFGDTAKFILPSHLAFGLTGDNNKIPPKATLIYDVKIIGINSKSIN